MSTDEIWWVRAKSARSDTWVNLDPSHPRLDIGTDSVALVERLRDSDAHDAETVDLYVVNTGRWQADMLWAQGAMILPVSDRFVATLRECGATGWKAVPARVHVRPGKPEMPGYQLLVVTGRCGDSERDLGADDLDPACEWDGSDLFWVASRGPSFAFFITGRVKRVLEEAGMSRVEFEVAE